MAGSGELSVEAQIHPRLGWLLLSLQTGESVDAVFFSMAFSTISPRSGISLPARNRVLPTGYLMTVAEKEDRYLLRDPRLSGQSIPDLEVGMSRLAGRAGVDGILGLDFFGRFIEVRFHLPSLRLTLIW